MNKGKVNAALGDERSESAWLPLLELAEIEVTSQTSANPIDGALDLAGTTEWHAAGPGKQVVRLTFEPPQAVQLVRVVVEERDRARTQEMVLRVALTPDGPWRQIVRQQFNFSPSGCTREEEDFRIERASITGLELTIIPDIRGGDSRASLRQLRVA